MVISAKALDASAGEWAQYRAECGWKIIRHEMPVAESSEALAHQLRASIRAAHAQRATHGGDPFDVLLLGDVESIPTWMFRQTEPSLFDADGPEYASDHPYQLIDEDDEIPDIALGRVALASDAEARAVLAKIRTYESAGGAGHGEEIDFASRRITYVAGEGRFGAADALMESMFISMVDTLVPPAFDLTMTYASAKSVYCPPPSLLTESVLNRLGEGSLLFNYLGHGWERGFDSLHWMDERIPILRVEDLERLRCGPGQRPIALLTCCSAGWYDLPAGRPSLAEAMLLHSAGPVAVIAASRPSHPYANTILQKDVTQLLLVDQVITLGELDLRAMQSMLKIDAVDRQIDTMARPLTSMMRLRGSLADCRLMHARMYNLLGDPAMVIRRPGLAIRDVEWRDGVVRGRVEGMSRGKIVITFESARTSPVHSDLLQQPLGEGDADLERKAIQNQPLANDRIIARYDADVIDGAFQAAVTATPPPAATTVKLLAHGEDAAGHDVSAFGATPVSRLDTGSSARTSQP
jgi:hypothetical protein